MLLKPTDNISLTPRIVYQKITANGFNRQEVFNLYANPFTTTRPKVNFEEESTPVASAPDGSDDLLQKKGTPSLRIVAS